MSTIQLPFPPSVNQIWRSVKGRTIKSKPYRTWQTKAGTELMCQRPETHEGPVEITMRFAMPDKRRRDLDNLCKPVLDILTYHQIIQRDDAEYVRKLTLETGQGFDGVQVEISGAELVEEAERGT